MGKKTKKEGSDSRQKHVQQPSIEENHVVNHASKRKKRRERESGRETKCIVLMMGV